MKNQSILKYQFKNAILLVLFASALLSVRAQEVLSNPAINSILRDGWNTEKLTARKAVIIDTLELPFFDDFAKPTIYPDASLWLDKTVYINRNYPINPISVGVATFDGVGVTGLPYDTSTVNSGGSMPADTLTSKPINLDFAADSVYLSFFYEPRGAADLPDEGDSLVLEFKTPVTSWSKVWAHDGYSANKVKNEDTTFRLVMLKILPTYLKKGFQFRFRNKATPGNDDQWHVDYIKLDRQRLIKDTIFNDVAFVYNPTSLLKNYEAMPWNQYNSSEMRSELINYIRNNDIIKNNTFYAYDVKDKNGNPVITGGGGAADIEPYKLQGYSRCVSPTPCPVMLRPPVNAPLPALTENTVYTVNHIIKPTGTISANDTLTRTQVFQNYYAYDDGTAELAYGLNAIGAKLAYQFNLNVADTLRAVDMYFHWMPNDKVNNISQRQFRLTIWNDDKGKPGSVIYQDSVTTPHYQYVHHTDWGNLTNAFYRYKLTSAFKVSGTIYVGWVQYSVDLLNIGFDKSAKSQSKMFYNTQGNWSNSQLAGSWMIHPVFGKASELVNVKDRAALSSAVNLYPNPANTNFYVDIDQTWASTAIKLTVYDAVGRIALNEKQLNKGEALDISQLKSGLYFVRIYDNKNNNCSKKLVIAR